MSDEEAADQWSLVCHGGGRTLAHRLIAYMDERIEHADRWHGAIKDWPRLQLAWGLLTRWPPSRCWPRCVSSTPACR